MLSLSKLFLPEELAGLSQRRTDVYDCLIAGMSEKRIAEATGLVRDTVHSHIKVIYRTAKVNSRTELAAMLIARLGLLMVKLDRQECRLPDLSGLTELDRVPLRQRLVVNGSGEVRTYGQDAGQGQQAV